jgi:hypothetical protein
MQDEEMATQTPATFSPISNKESLIQDLPLFSWKMSEGLSVPNSNQTDGTTQKKHLYCFMSLEKWKESVTNAIGAYSQREKQACPILGKESLSWEKEQILTLLGLKSFPSTFRTVTKGQNGTVQPLIFFSEDGKRTRMRETVELTTQPFYYKRLLNQLLALKESNPQAFARLAVEIESNNSTNPLELLEKTWATPSTKETQMTMTPAQIVERQLMMQDSGDRKDKKTDMLTHQVTMNEFYNSARTWETPTKRDYKDTTYTPEALMNRLDKGHQDSMAMQALRSNTNKDLMNWLTPKKTDFKQTTYSPEALATYIQKGHQESMPIQALRSDTNKDSMNWATPAKGDQEFYMRNPNYIQRQLDKGRQDTMAMQALRSNKLTFTELRTMREQALAKPETERTQEEINLLNYREMLNPRWVEMLMGLPIGWTMKGCVKVIQASWMK